MGDYIMTEDCELCGKDDELIDFHYMLPMGVSFESDVSDDPQIFRATVCLNCMAACPSDAHVVIAVAKKRKA